MKKKQTHKREKQTMQSGKHLFNTEMGVCIHCGISAEEDLHAPTRCKKK